MFVFDCHNSSPHIKLDYGSWVDHDIFLDDVNYLKSLHLHYDHQNKIWKVPEKRLEELLLWFQRDNQNYDITSECSDYLKTKEPYRREILFFKDRIFDDSILNQGITLKDFQIEAIQKRLQRNNYLDAYDTGLGKTVVNLCVFSFLLNAGLIDGIIILCPIGLGFQWEHEILNFVNVFKEEDIQIIDNSLKIKCFEKFQDKKILIIRHDLLSDVLASYSKNYKAGKSLKKHKWSEFNIKEKWDKKSIFLCVDESHAFKHSSSIKTRALHSLKKNCDYKALLTATPAINGLADIYTSFDFLDSSIISKEEGAFKLWVAKYIGNTWDKYAINSYDTTKVKQILDRSKHIFFQKNKKDVPEMMTILNEHRIACDVSYTQRLLYQAIADKELSVLKEKNEKLTWQQLFMKLPLLLEVLDNPELLKKRQYNDPYINNLLSKVNIENDNKFICVKEKVRSLIEDQNKKVILYDIHPTTLDLLYEKFKKYNPLIIHGELKVKDKDKDRKEKQDLFNFDPKYKIILLSLYTSSAGINLQYGGSDIIVNTLAWDATLYRQCKSRTDRINSIYDSNIYLPYFPKSLDNLRMQKNFRRVALNDKLGGFVSQEDLEKLMNGFVI